MDDLPLRIVDLHKRYGGVEALRGVSFELRHGERLAFLGPNGAGKSTMIRSLAGRCVPSRGEILVFGQPRQSKLAKQAIGWIPQEIALYDDLTSRENLIAFARFHGVPRRAIRSQVSWALKWTGLEDRKHHLVKTFSGGMQRRLNIACGVLHQPKILLLDEPTVGVDPQSRQRIFEMLDELCRNGTSILLTTHHLEEAQQRSDRIVILDAGKIVAEGSFDELVAKTVGHSNLVRIRLDRAVQAPFRLKHHLRPGIVGPSHNLVTEGSRAIETKIDDVNEQLAVLINSIHTEGYRVVDLDVQAPSLHHVFLELTGNELRD
ncbi:ABC transporter ATP-binding protein [Stieleria sp. JC731]|uniref:ABC transporter ATP-binding protein n=1 Tax=Pirellulaceae TaxID=2691357 RepID=UPI001E33DF54|nr:ABC transporter ATP-binding protein [Stieleria sp. JC731]MCC9603031.1 ABC transporter ATP-binding protein [Stieleria sp. JC731]